VETSALEGLAVAVPGSRPLAGVEVVAEDEHLRMPAQGDDGEAAQEPLPRLRYASAISDADGRFRLEGVPPGTPLRIRAAAPGHVPVEWEPRSDFHGPPSQLRLEVPIAGTLRGVVRDSRGGPVAEARVRVATMAYFRFLLQGGRRLEPCEAGRPVVVRTDSRGRYEAWPVPVGAALSVQADGDRGEGSATVYDAIVSPDPGTSELDVVLREPGALRIRLLGGERDSPDAAEASLVRIESAALDEWRLRDCEWPGGSGVFEAPRAPPGRWRIEAISKGESPARAVTEVEVLEGETTEVVLALVPLERLHGVVLGAPGAPPGEATLRCVPLVGGSPSWRELFDGKAGEDGVFEVPGLVPGDYRLSVLIFGLELPVADRIRIPSEPVEVRLPAFGFVRFRLPFSESGDDVDIWIWHRARPGPEAASDATCDRANRGPDGGLSAGPLMAGPGTLWIRTPGGAWFEVPVDVPPDGVADLGPVTPGESLVACGRLVDPRGRPLAGASLHAFTGPELDWGTESFRTDAEGRFAIGPVRRGRLRVKACHPGFPDVVTEIDAGRGGESILVLPEGGVLRGTLRTHTGLPLSRRIAVYATDDERLEEPVEGALSNLCGEFEFRVPEGRWRIAVGSPRRDEPWRESEVGVVEIRDRVVVEQDYVLLE
jgi:hypothetical protein